MSNQISDVAVDSVLQLTANDAKSVCAHEWMKEALDRFLFNPENEEEQRSPWLSDLTRTEEPKIGKPALSVQNEDVNRSVRKLTYLPIKEAEFQICKILPLPFTPCSTLESRFGRVAQGGEEEVNRGVTVLV